MCGLGNNWGKKGQSEGTEANLCRVKADMYLGENNHAVNGMDLISVGTCFEERVDRKEQTQVSVLKQPQPDKSKHRTYWELLAWWRDMGNDGFQDTGHQATKVSDAWETPQCTALRGRPGWRGWESGETQALSFYIVYTKEYPRGESCPENCPGKLPSFQQSTDEHICRRQLPTTGERTTQNDEECPELTQGWEYFLLPPVRLEKNIIYGEITQKDLASIVESSPGLNTAFISPNKSFFFFFL